MADKKQEKTIERLGYCLLFLGLCWFHIVTEEGGDTLIFRQYISQWGFWEFLENRLHTITGRVFLEGILYGILQSPSWVFSCANTAIILWGVALCKYLMDWDSLETGIFALLLLLFPVNGLVEVGIQPGFINYVWSLVFSLAALVPLRMVQKEQPFFWYHGFLFGTAALFGCNMEQTAAVVTGFYLFYILYFYHEKKFHPLILLQLFLSGGSLLFLRTCEGNTLRMQAEILSKWPGFSQLSLAEKIGNGWITTVNYLFSIPNEPVFIFICTLCLWLYRKRKINIFSCLSMLVLIWTGIVGIVKILELLQKSGLQEKMNGIFILFDEYGRIMASPVPLYPQIFLYSLLALGTMAAVAGSFTSWEEAAFYLLILGAGFSTRMVIGLSPTLIASNIRTFLFFHFSLYLTAIHYIHQIRASFYR